MKCNETYRHRDTPIVWPHLKGGEGEGGVEGRVEGGSGGEDEGEGEGEGEKMKRYRRRNRWGRGVE